MNELDAQELTNLINAIKQLDPSQLRALYDAIGTRLYRVELDNKKAIEKMLDE